MIKECREYITKNKDFLESLNGKYNLLEIYDVANMLDGFYNNSNSNSSVNGGNGVVGNGNTNYTRSSDNRLPGR